MVDSIILYDSNETEFRSNGLGSLADILSCVITEERNGGFELEAEYPVNGIHYSDIALRTIILSKPNPYSDPQPFRIYSISRPINGIVTISAEHISYDLSGYPVSPYTANGVSTALSGLITNCPMDCPFIFRTDKETVHSFSVDTPSSIRSRLGGTEGSILDIYGGEYEFDKFNVYLHSSRGEDRGVAIEYGKNLTDLKQEENCQDLYTGVYPYWKGSTTSDDGSESEDILVTLTEKILPASGTYNFQKILPLDLSDKFDSSPTEAQLRNAAKRYISDNDIGVPKINLDVSFLQLPKEEYNNLYFGLDEVRLCDTVQVSFPLMNVSSTAKCVKTEYDAVTGRYKSISLGDTRYSIADTVSDSITSYQTEIKDAVGKMERSIDRATKLITGASGGHVVIHTNASGEPYEILIMDTNSVDTAKKVWRWNSGGLGYSDSGYNGDYGTAITMDGVISADYITAGELSGELISAGSIPTGSLSDGTAIQNAVDEVNNVYSQWITLGTSGLIIGANGDSSEAQIRLCLTNNNIKFNVGNTELSSINSKEFTFENGNIGKKLRIGRYAFIPRANGSTDFKRIISTNSINST